MNKFKMFDMFGTKISFSFRNNEMFRSFEGALISLILIMTITGFSINSFFKLISNSNLEVF